MLHRHREAMSLQRGERLRDFVFGYNDGAVTTLSVMIAILAADAHSSIVVLAAMANIFGSGIAFALGDYISAKSEIDLFRNYAGGRGLSRHERTEAREILRQFDRPHKIAVMALVAFILSGSLALLPFLFIGGAGAIPVSILLTFSGVFLVGMARARYTHGDVLRSGAEMLAVAALALLAAFFIGEYIISSVI
jgi:predicted membrane protein (TIGR00267 family)